MLAERVLLVICGLCLGMTVTAEETVKAEEEESAPETEFLEYLGMWEETDEDWLVFDDEQLAEMDKRSDPAPEGEESPEKTDES